MGLRALTVGPILMVPTPIGSVLHRIRVLFWESEKVPYSLTRSGRDPMYPQSIPCQFLMPRQL